MARNLLSRLGAGFLVLSILGLLVGCMQKPQPILKIGANHWPGYAPLYLADEQGLLQQAHIQLVEYPSTLAVMRALRNGILDAAAVTLDEALLLADSGLALDILLVADVSLGADLLISQPNLTRAQDLKGKKIGVEATALGGYLLKRFLTLNQLTPDDLEVVTLPVNKHIQAFTEKKVDAVITFASEVANLAAEKKYQVLFDTRDIPNEVVDVLVIRRQDHQAWENHIQALLTAWFQSLTLWELQPYQQDAALMRRLNINATALKESLQGMQMGTLALNRTLLTQGQLEASLQKVRTYLYQQGRLLNPQADVGVIETGLLEQVER